MDDLAAHSEQDRLLGSLPLLDKHLILKDPFRRLFRVEALEIYGLELGVSIKIRLEVLEEDDFFIQMFRVILDGI
jgi:hypothetical protein